jgi:K+-transporting ATPase KdpF subunit
MESAMDLDLALACTASLGLVVYLAWALIYPEKF